MASDRKRKRQNSATGWLSRCAKPRSSARRPCDARRALEVRQLTQIASRSTARCRRCRGRWLGCSRARLAERRSSAWARRDPPRPPRPRRPRSCPRAGSSSSRCCCTSRAHSSARRRCGGRVSRLCCESKLNCAARNSRWCSAPSFCRYLGWGFVLFSSFAGTKLTGFGESVTVQGG